MFLHDVISACTCALIRINSWHVRTSDRVRGTTAKMERCLGCGLTTTVGDRRSLNTAYSQQVVPALMEIAEAMAKDEGSVTLRINVQANSYMCRKCFGAFSKYVSLKEQLIENMKKVFAQRSDLHVDRQRDTEVYVGSKS